MYFKPIVSSETFPSFTMTFSLVSVDRQRRHRDGIHRLCRTCFDRNASRLVGNRAQATGRSGRRGALSVPNFADSNPQYSRENSQELWSKNPARRSAKEWCEPHSRRCGMKLIFAGGRKYQVTAHDYFRLDALRVEHFATEEVSGKASGADSGSEAWVTHRAKPLWCRSGPALERPPKTRLFGIAQQGGHFVQ